MLTFLRHLQDFYWSAIRDYGQFRSEYMVMASKVVHRIMQSTGGRFNALHMRATDWASEGVQQWEHAGKGWYRTAKDINPKIVQVSY